MTRRLAQPTLIPPPSGAPLGAAGERLYAALTEQYGRDVEVAYLARCAAEAWERAEDARELVKREGMTVVVGRGCFAHPGIKVETQARAGFLAALRVLRQPARRAKVGRPGLGDVLSESARRRGSLSAAERVRRYVTGTPA
jgi:hypothetical protein